MEEKIRVLAISDIHGRPIEEETLYKDIDLIILAGDLCRSDDPGKQKEELPKVIKSVRDLCEGGNMIEVVVVPGNHDYWLERNYQSPPSLRTVLGPLVRILVDETYNYVSLSTGRTIRIHGSPRTSLSRHAFPHLYKNEDLQKIPVDGSLDILVSHEAPRVDEAECIEISKEWYKDELPGSLPLLWKVLEAKPKVHIFGHIHYGCEYQGEWTRFYNVAWPQPKIITV